MGCKSPRTLWVKAGGRMSILPAGTILPGQSGPIAPDFVGFKGSGMHPGQIVTLDCRTCASCVVKYQNALIGSLLAETAYSQQAVRLDLTYANDPGSDSRSDLAHKMLNGGHIREFTERMRKARGFGRVRYLVAGEYGPLRGRAHWHSVLIFEDGMPPFDFSAARYNDERLWPYGFVRARPVGHAADFAYACKYAVKSTKAMQGHEGFMPGVETVLRRSRIPPLGLPFFLERARQAADFGIPLSMHYMPPGGLKVANYHVRGLASRSRMAHAYLDRLAENGYDVRFYRDAPPSYQPCGPRIPLSPDKDIDRLLATVCRERRLAALPEKTLQQDVAEMVADFGERQARQLRINRLEDQKRVDRELRRSRRLLRRLAAERRIAAEERRLAALSVRPSPPVFDAGGDPFGCAGADWDDFDADLSAFDVVRSGSWRDF